MTAFEKKLKLLFDAQDFFRNPKLDAVINSDAEYFLKEEELKFVSAAGDPLTAVQKEDTRGNE